MILSFLLALLAFLALLPILAPLLRGSRPVAERARFDQAVYRDQLQELDRDIARGLVTEQDAETARIEIQRRLLAAGRTAPQPVRLARSPAMAAVVLVLVGGGSVATYVYLGAPGLPDMPYASRPPQPQNAERGRLRQAADELAVRLQQNPKDGSGWLLLARNLAELGSWNQAEGAYAKALALGQDTPEIRAAHGETLALQAGGTVTPAAEAEFRQALAADPDNAVARYYLALGRGQAGEPKQAIDGFQALLAILPSDSPLRAQIGRQIAAAAQAAGVPMPELAKGTAPAGNNAAAGQDDVRREQMIRGMVAGLAAKLEADPGNFDGWMRLGRAYAVLREGDKAEAAYGKARALRPDDLSVPEAEAQALLMGLQPNQKLPDRLLALMHEIEAKDPKQQMAQWYLGLAAVQGGDLQEARRHWQTLAAELPEGSQDRKMVEAALATLPDGASAAGAKPEK